MWTGWSFLRHEIKLLLQTVEYMKSITFLVTCNDVVLETLRHSKQFAAECGAENIVVTYDLAIAKNGKKFNVESNQHLKLYSFNLVGSILN